MLFELHITVEGGADSWIALCRTLGVKPLHIELSSGKHRQQLMFAATHDSDIEGALVWAESMRKSIVPAGFEVLRTKLECPLDKAYTVSDRDRTSYAECHMKLMMPKDATFEDVYFGDLVHASRNLLSTEENGLQKFYLTQRHYGDGIREASDQFGAAYERVRERFPPVRMEMEKVLYDTHPELDAGWAT